MADRHILAKQAIHEMANQEGLAATFMAKYNKDSPGNSCHIHSKDHHGIIQSQLTLDVPSEFQNQMFKNFKISN